MKMLLGGVASMRLEREHFTVELLSACYFLLVVLPPPCVDMIAFSRCSMCGGLASFPTLHVAHMSSLCLSSLTPFSTHNPSATVSARQAQRSHPRTCLLCFLYAGRPPLGFFHRFLHKRSFHLHQRGPATGGPPGALQPLHPDLIPRTD